MIVHGKVENGQVVLTDDAQLPEGAQLTIQIRSGRHDSEDESAEDNRSMLERMGSIVGSAKTLPPDAAKNVDHYLYGHPKKP